MQTSVYEAAGGRNAFIALAVAWHRRCLDDPVVSHAFTHGSQHPHHARRLAAYWGEALGGPADYTASVGDHTQVVRMHSGNGEHQEMDDRAYDCFVAALDDADWPADERLRETVTAWFRAAITEMAAYPDTPDDVPGRLPMPHWSWAGAAS